MSKKAIKDLVTKIEEPEEFSAILEQNEKLLLSKLPAHPNPYVNTY